MTADLITAQAARIEALTEVLTEVAACMLDGGDGVKGDFGWSIMRLTKARPMIRAALKGEPT
jgi:hypothetical protein